MTKLSRLFVVLAIVLSHFMCVIVAYNYRDMLCGIEHAGYSAPANIAFLYAIPFVAGIIVCVILAIRFKKKFEFERSNYAGNNECKSNSI